jgi:hypothetical protein
MSKQIMAISALLAVLFTSCQKEITGVTENKPNSNKLAPIAAKVNGLQWAVPALESPLRNGTDNFEYYAYYLDPLTSSADTSNISVYGYGLTFADSILIGSDKLAVNIIGFYGPGTYAIGTGSAVFVSQKGVDPDRTVSVYESFGDANDQITVTSYNRVKGTISGTFNFNARTTDGSDEVKVTEGNFTEVPFK